MGTRLRRDGAITLAVLLVQFGWALLAPEKHPLDAPGALLLVLATAPLLLLRTASLPAFLLHVALAIPYHALDYPHEALTPATMVALFAAARYGNRRRTAVVMPAVIVVALLWTIVLRIDDDTRPVYAVGATGWIVVVCVAGEAARLQQAYLAEVIDRADRAENTREEEARRQVAEERLRIARDLHDLLAHTITLIQVQAGVAAHLITERKAEPATVLGALDTITDACADARAELTATVGVLRAPLAESRAPLPTLAQLRGLAEPAEAAGVTVEFTVNGAVRPLAPAVEMVGYRIVQEALTNVAKHSAASRALVELDYRTDRLIIRILDNGRAGPAATTGFGIRGMRERAEAIGGTLETSTLAAEFGTTASRSAISTPEPTGTAAPLAPTTYRSAPTAPEPGVTTTGSGGPAPASTRTPAQSASTAPELDITTTRSGGPAPTSTRTPAQSALTTPELNITPAGSGVPASESASTPARSAVAAARFTSASAQLGSAAAGFAVTAELPVAAINAERIGTDRGEASTTADAHGRPDPAAVHIEAAVADSAGGAA
ncbi:histidine kinase [Nocardia nepalensis]|uniref:sensor histidine kinase n=1 Tax=Nocardia nepalensis TaxID=3375448 RepID=UPI003B66BD48